MLIVTIHNIAFISVCILYQLANVLTYIKFGLSFIQSKAKTVAIEMNLSTLLSHQYFVFFLHDLKHYVFSCPGELLGRVAVWCRWAGEQLGMLLWNVAMLVLKCALLLWVLEEILLRIVVSHC